MSPQAPARLLVFLHGAGSTPEVFAPVALAWQLKFPGAHAVILQGLHSRPAGGHDWFDGRGVAVDRIARVEQAALQVRARIESLQAATGIDAARTVLVGYSQGATLALELARGNAAAAAIVVGYAARLSRPIGKGEQVNATVHLIHGEFDSLVPTVHAQQALRGLRAGGAEATLDIVAEHGHTISQEMIILGTTRVMQTVFQGRARARRGGPSTLH